MSVLRENNPCSDGNNAQEYGSVYKINYYITKNGAQTRIYKFDIVSEKPTYYTIKCEFGNSQIKKSNINHVTHNTGDYNSYYVYVLSLDEKESYIREMMKRMSENYSDFIKRYTDSLEKITYADGEVEDGANL